MNPTQNNLPSTPINLKPIRQGREQHSPSSENTPNTTNSKLKKVFNLQMQENQNNLKMERNRFPAEKNTKFYDFVEICNKTSDLIIENLKEDSKKFISPQKKSECIDKLKFDFEEGDLTYGLSSYRLKFLLRNFRDLDDRVERLDDNRLVPGHKNPVAIDTINNLFLGTGAELMLMTKTESSKFTKEQRDEFNCYNPKKELDSEPTKLFKKFLCSHKKYNPQNCRELNEILLRIGRACKGGIEYTTTKMNKRIHFILDGIDFERVITDLDIKKECRDITGKELRWIYRHRKDENVMGRIIFYKDNVVTEAPWKSDKELWKKYKNIRADRNRIN